jgi:CRISPR-associated protein Cmr3
MVLSTPAYFENGWLPSWINKDSLTGTFPNTQIKIKLISVTMGKYKSIGGFDYKIRKPKPSKRFVPAGSVYYFQVLNENNINWDSILSSHGKSITDNHKENDDSIRYNYRNQGFGISYIGKCPNLS